MGRENDAEVSGFYALPTLSLSARGIHGKRPEVYCFGDVLELRGDHGAVVAIPASTVRVLRLGVGGSRSGTFHMARLFIDGEVDQLLLRAANQYCPGYRDTMYRFAHAVAQARGLGALEHGSTRGGAIGQLVAVVVIAAFFAAVAVIFWSEEAGMIGAMVFTAVMAAVIVLFVWEFIVHDTPKPMRSLDEADRYLPKRR